MRISHKQANLFYQLTFGSPAFALPKNVPDVLGVFHETLAPRFPIRSTDMEGFGGTAMSDVRIRIKMFNGQVNLELFVDRLTATFPNLVNPQDYKVVEECLELADQALRKSMLGVKRGSADYRRSIWFTCEEGIEAARRLVKGHLNPGLLDRDIGHGLRLGDATVRGKFDNVAQKWSALADLEPSIVVGSHIFFDLTLTFQEGGDFNSVKERSDHCDVMLVELLKFFGLELAPQIR